ncbi:MULTISPECIES: hypothetical protein [unclassified Isoptericola]|uniref:hypothetical protein n=1 Tax=unclassified Isoptericola TaxID=2623355 RepID=UPI00365068DD
MIRTVRPLLTGRHGRLAGVLLVLTLIAGVVLMHAMSGSASQHGGGGHHAVTVAAEHHAATLGAAHSTTPDAAPDSAPGIAPAVTADDDRAPAGCGDGGCGSHDIVTAMCLMILAVLLVLAGPGARSLLRVEGPRGGPWHPLAAASRPAAGPSLHALGISRT